MENIGNDAEGPVEDVMSIEDDPQIGNTTSKVLKEMASFLALFKISL